MSLYFINLQGAVNRKLEKKKKGKKSDPICEMLSKKDFDLGGFKYTLVFDAKDGLTRSSLLFLARIAGENPGLAQEMGAALGDGPNSAFIKYLEDTCGKSTQEAFMDCARPIVAEKKLCSPDCNGSLRFKNLDRICISCTLMLALMSLFPGMPMEESEECLLGEDYDGYNG